MKKDFNIQLGERVRTARKEMKFSREELAELLEISTLFLSYIECGQKGVSIQTLCKICQTLNVSADYILFGKTNPDFHKTDAQILLDNLDIQYHPLAKDCLQTLSKSITYIQKLSDENHK